MDNLPLHPVDIAVIVVLLLSAGLAFARGLVHEILSVVSWVGAFFASIYGVEAVRPYFRQIIAPEFLADMAAGSTLFVVTLVVLWIASHSISKKVQESALNALDRSLGFLFGLIRGGVILCIVYLGALWLFTPPSEAREEKKDSSLLEKLLPKPEAKPEEQTDWVAWISEARSAPLLHQGSEILIQVLPRETMEIAKDTLQTAGGGAKKMLENERMIRQMIAPAPKGSAGGSGGGNDAGGYQPTIRRELDRLIQQSK